MSLTTSEMTPADIAAVTGAGNGFGNGFNGDGWWIILFLILAMGGSWGNGFGNGGGSAPWIMNTDNDIERGFNQMATINGINSLQAAVTGGFANTATQLCNGFSQAEIADNARQMANMNQIFGLQTAMTQGFNNMGSQFADCCCENRLGIADLKYTVATENCADRQALSDGVRDIIANQTAGIQTIIDKLCAQELEAEKRENANLRTQLNMANLAASQTAQTSKILADNAAQTVALEQYLNPVPVPAYAVQNPNCCTNTCSCNSGCGGF